MKTALQASNAPDFKQWLSLIAACLTGILIPLSFTGPAVVLPSINQALGGSAFELSWVLNAYILTYGSAMMAAGSLSDIHGRKRVWVIGLVIFILSTLAVPHATSVLQIDLLRLIQGLGGAGAFAGAMASLAQTFHGPIRTRVFSLLGTTFGIGLAFGPLAAGALVDGAGWAWVFFATALVALIGLLLVMTCVVESRDPDATGLDWPGALSFTAALTLFTYGMLLAPEAGWASPSVSGSLLASLSLFFAFVKIEQRVARPMLDLSLLRSPRFVGVQLLAASPAFFFVVLIVMLPSRFIGIDGHTALQAGQMMIALAVPLLAVPFLAALLARWFTAGALSAVGLLLVAVGLAWLGRTLGKDSADSFLPMALIGVGIGLPWGLMDGMAVSVVDKQRAGMATGIFNAVRVSADGVAIAMAGALLASLIQSGLVSSVAGVSSERVLNAANRAALGDLQHALALLPGQVQDLREQYASSFSSLLYVLSGLCAATAFLIFALLGKVRAHEQALPTTPGDLKTMEPSN